MMLQPPGAPPNEVVFPPFRLDLLNEQLVNGDRIIALRPKTYAVLRYLVERRGLLVTKDQILDAVWPATAVSDSVLKVCIREIREALDDNPGTPRFVETAHRRGYRFIAPIVEPRHPTTASVLSAPPAPRLVGRSNELARMQSRLARAVAGRRIVAFVTGEPGIGKSALVEAFIESAALGALTASNLGRASLDLGLFVGRGQCIEHYGAGEAYLPILEALTQLCRLHGGERVVAALARYAPTWLAQLPAVTIDDTTVVSPPAGSPEPMLREMADAVEAITREVPLLLVLEDLHWSDASTIALIAYLARRRESARLMLVGTYRPAEVIETGHPLRAVVQELLAHGACENEQLGLLDEPAIDEYLSMRLRDVRAPTHASRTLHRHTSGNPLFLVSLVDYLLERGGLNTTSSDSFVLTVAEDEFAVPATVSGVIDRQLDRVAEGDRHLLQVASVAGAQFTVAEVAAAVEAPHTAVEAIFERLARSQQFVQRLPPVELPDKSLTSRFSFVHAMHQHVLYERVPLALRIDLHRKIGDWLERGFPSSDVASALAMHFERGRDYRRAVRYCRIASETAQQRFAFDEAITLATRGLALLDKAWADGLARDREELQLRLALGVPLLAARGYGASEVEHTYQRALDLSQQLGESSPTFPMLAGLFVFYLLRADLAIAESLSGQLLEQASAASEPEMSVFAHWSGLITALNQGRFVVARDYFAATVPLFERIDTGSYLTRFSHDAEISCRAFGAWTLWSLGDISRAHDELKAARTRASNLAHPHSVCFSHFFTAFIHQMQGEAAAVREHAARTIHTAIEHGFPQWAAFGTILRGWAVAVAEDAEKGITEIQEGLAAYRATGAAISMPHFLALYAEATAAAGRPTEALTTVLEAIAEARRTGGSYYESELLRIEANIRLMRQSAGDDSVARMRLQEAISVASRQQAPGFEQRSRERLMGLAARGERPGAHRDRRGAPLARRDD